MTREQYIEKFRGVVIEVVRGTGLFPSLMMAQAILESGDKMGVPGNSTLARLYNNHFGIKADKSWTGKKVNLKTGEVFDGKETVIKDYFRVYENVNESFKDRVEFLKKNARYKINGVFSAQTPFEQAQALKRAGYATDPNYAEKLQLLMSKHNLATLDKMVL